jgi:hypothetical protein
MSMGVGKSTQKPKNTSTAAKFRQREKYFHSHF